MRKAARHALQAQPLHALQGKAASARRQAGRRRIHARRNLACGMYRSPVAGCLMNGCSRYSRYSRCSGYSGRPVKLALIARVGRFVQAHLKRRAGEKNRQLLPRGSWQALAHICCASTHGRFGTLQPRALQRHAKTGVTPAPRLPPAMACLPGQHGRSSAGRSQPPGRTMPHACKIDGFALLHAWTLLMRKEMRPKSRLES